MKRRSFLPLFLLPLFLAAGIASAALTPADVKTYTATGTSTWTKPFGARVVKAICIGAAGGGGGGRGSTAGTNRQGGSGGGGGAIAEGTFNASDLGATETITVGTGGTAGPGGSSADGTAGGVGGNSSFGT